MLAQLGILLHEGHIIIEERAESYKNSPWFETPTVWIKTVAIWNEIGKEGKTKSKPLKISYMKTKVRCPVSLSLPSLHFIYFICLFSFFLLCWLYLCKRLWFWDRRKQFRYYQFILNKEIKLIGEKRKPQETSGYRQWVLWQTTKDSFRYFKQILHIATYKSQADTIPHRTGSKAETKNNAGPRTSSGKGELSQLLKARDEVVATTDMPKMFFHIGKISMMSPVYSEVLSRTPHTPSPTRIK